MINVSSLLGRFPLPSPLALVRAPYSASKYFLCCFTDAYREEVHQKFGAGITVTTLLPGPVATDFERRQQRLTGESQRRKPVRRS